MTIDATQRQLHACFISYRHPASASGREAKLIQHVVRALQDHLEVYTHEHDVFFDKDRLVPGYQYDEKLAQALCRSACMVVVYWPSYLESDYCKKEIGAMLSIERRRRDVLGEALHGCRLFVPVILRGRFEDLPSDLRDGCHYLDYKAQAIRPDFNIGDDPAMSEQLFRIAEYVKSLCDKMKTVQEQLLEGCDRFILPAPIVETRIVKAVPVQPFPGR